MRTHDHDYEESSLRPKASRVDARPSGHLLQAAAVGRTDVLDQAGILGLQRAVGNGGVGALLEEENTSPVHDVLRSGGGSPLAPDVKDEMEGRLGHDFSDVRVHNDGAASESAKSVNAHAYTVGSNVVFQRDQYDPSSSAGKTMLAHELTHVVQQRSGPVDGTSRGWRHQGERPVRPVRTRGRRQRRSGDVRSHAVGPRRRVRRGLVRPAAGRGGRGARGGRGRPGRVRAAGRGGGRGPRRGNRLTAPPLRALPLRASACGSTPRARICSRGSTSPGADKVVRFLPTGPKIAILISAARCHGAGRALPRRGVACIRTQARDVGNLCRSEVHDVPAS